MAVMFTVESAKYSTHIKMVKITDIWEKSVAVFFMVKVMGE
jgi:hypothetical protein